MALIGDLIGRIRYEAEVDPLGVEAGLRQTEAQIKSSASRIEANRPTVEIDADLDRFERSIKALEAHKTKLERDLTEVPVDADTSAAHRALSVLDKRLDLMEKRRRILVDARTLQDTVSGLNDVDVHAGRLRRTLGFLTREGNILQGSLSGLRLQTGFISGGFGALARASVILSPIIAAVGAAVTALVVSLGAAVAGLGALAVAFGGAFLLAAGAAAGAIARFKEESEKAGTAAHALAQAANRIDLSILGPAFDPILRGVANGLGRINELLREIRPAAIGFGRQFGSAIERLMKSLTSPGMSRGISSLLRLSGNVFQPAQRALGALFRLLTNIARAAMPALVQGFRSVADSISAMARGTSDIGKLRDSIDPLIGHLQSWLNLMGAIGDIGVALFGAMGVQAKGFVDDLARGAQNIANFIRSAEGSQQIKQFFADTLPLARELVTFLGQMSLVILQVGQFLAPLFTAFLRGFNDSLRVINQFLAILNQIPAGVRAAFGTAATIVASLLSPLGKVRTVIGLTAGALAVLGGAFGGLSNAAGRAASAVVGALANVGGAARNAGRAIANGFVTAIRAAVGGARSAGNAVATAAVAAFRALTGAGASAGRAVGGAAVAAVRGVAGAARSAGSAVGNAAVAAVRALTGAASSAGRSLGSAVASGISSMAGAIADAASSIWETAKSILSAPIRMVVELDLPSIPSPGDLIGKAGSILGLASGGRVDRPMFLAGEEAPRHPEYVIATNPAYRQRNISFLEQAAKELGVQAFRKGGRRGDRPKRKFRVGAVPETAAQADFTRSKQRLDRAEQHIKNLRAKPGRPDRKDMKQAQKQLQVAKDSFKVARANFKAVKRANNAIENLGSQIQRDQSEMDLAETQGRSGDFTRWQNEKVDDINSLLRRLIPASRLAKGTFAIELKDRIAQLRGEKEATKRSLPGAAGLLAPAEGRRLAEIQRDIALAGLTVEREDDISASQRLVAFWQGVLSRLQKTAGVPPSFVQEAAEQLRAATTATSVGGGPGGIVSQGDVFLGARQALLRGFAGNVAFKTASVSPFTMAGGGAGAPAGGPTIVNNFGAPPPDPHTWTQQMAFEVQAV